MTQVLDEAFTREVMQTCLSRGGWRPQVAALKEWPEEQRQALLTAILDDKWLEDSDREWWTAFFNKLPKVR